MKGHLLGLPRIGKNRELKKSLENYWNGSLCYRELQATGKIIREENIKLQLQSNLDLITVGDFSFYDQVLDTSFMLGNIPSRFQKLNLDEIDRYFSVARGITLEDKKIYPSDMRKYFNTNYHYIVPEIEKENKLKLNSSKIVSEVTEAMELGVSPNRIKPVIIGPVTYLWLSRGDIEDKVNYFKQLETIYNRLLLELKELGVNWIQIDEPILALDKLDRTYRSFFESFYSSSKAVKVLLTTYFDTIEDNLDIVKELKVDGLHLDLTAVYSNKLKRLDFFGSLKFEVISLGILNSRNIWSCDLNKIINYILSIKDIDTLWLSTSSSLQFLPVTKSSEELPCWLSFAWERVQELGIILDYFNGRDISRFLDGNRKALVKLKDLRGVNRIDNYPLVSKGSIGRRSEYKVREELQDSYLNLPEFPTTTIGSFPQTKEVRSARSKWRKGIISDSEYRAIIKEQIKDCIAIQEKIGLDVLVHGEFERTDMVEYFAEYINGYLTTRMGWVQSYGSRCVKPGIVYHDLYREGPITTEWTKLAKSLTKKHVKGMLTGPVTMLKWSFVRDDIPFSETLDQMSVEINKEVRDLERDGISIIQVDEAALKEGLPLKERDKVVVGEEYSRAFNITTSGLSDRTQIHTHMCYSDFKDILSVIEAMDADVITIECSRSNMDLLSDFKEGFYLNSIGPGVYDIHSPNIPDVEEVKRLINRALEYVPANKLWVNPDCGLKTRGWDETISSLENLVSATKDFR